MKVLLVDDDPFALKLLARQLANLSFNDARLFGRAYDALAWLRDTNNADCLVFCDLQMPEMDGIEFVRNLSKIGFQGGLVLVSGEDDRILQSATRVGLAYRLNIIGGLHKPVIPSQLQELLCTNLNAVHMTPRSARRKYHPGELQRAISQGELVNYYQPQVDVSSGKIAGMETLVRWQHPQEGLIYPDQFIPIAEHHNLMDDLTLCVLNDGLCQARQWMDAGFEWQLAVNMSMDNFASLDFPDFIEERANETGVPLSTLTMEVTESRLMRDRQASLDIFTRLRLKNTDLSIDDFGTGHSSLLQLHDLPFNELKIDKGFVHGACHDAPLRAIFQASLGMAKDLGIRAVAEGVETAEDWAFLRASQCDLAQGFYIGKPMLAEELDQWVEEWEKRRGNLIRAV